MESPDVVIQTTEPVQSTPVVVSRSKSQTIETTSSPTAGGGRSRHIFMALLLITLLYNLYQVHSGDMNKITQVISLMKSRIQGNAPEYPWQQQQIEFDDVQTPGGYKGDDIEQSLKVAASHPINIYGEMEELANSPNSWLSIGPEKNTVGEYARNPGDVSPVSNQADVPKEASPVTNLGDVPKAASPLLNQGGISKDTSPILNQVDIPKVVSPVSGEGDAKKDLGLVSDQGVISKEADTHVDAISQTTPEVQGQSQQTNTNTLSDPALPAGTSITMTKVAR